MTGQTKPTCLDDCGKSAQVKTSVVSAIGRAAAMGISGRSLETTGTYLGFLFGGKNEYPSDFSKVLGLLDLEFPIEALLFLGRFRLVKDDGNSAVESKDLMLWSLSPFC